MTTLVDVPISSSEDMLKIIEHTSSPPKPTNSSLHSPPLSGSPLAPHWIPKDPGIVKPELVTPAMDRTNAEYASYKQCSTSLWKPAPESVLRTGLQL